MVMLRFKSEVVTELLQFEKSGSIRKNSQKHNFDEIVELFSIKLKKSK